MYIHMYIYICICMQGYVPEAMRPSIEARRGEAKGVLSIGLAEPSFVVSKFLNTSICTCIYIYACMYTYMYIQMYVDM